MVSIIYLFDPQSTEAKLNYIMISSAINHERLIYDTESVKILSQRGTRYVDFLIPGLLAMGIMNGFPLGNRLWSDRDPDQEIITPDGGSSYEEIPFYFFPFFFPY